MSFTKEEKKELVKLCLSLLALGAKIVNKYNGDDSEADSEGEPTEAPTKKAAKKSAPVPKKAVVEEEAEEENEDEATEADEDDELAEVEEPPKKAAQKVTKEMVREELVRIAQLKGKVKAYGLLAEHGNGVKKSADLADADVAKVYNALKKIK